MLRQPERLDIVTILGAVVVVDKSDQVLLERIQGHWYCTFGVARVRHQVLLGTHPRLAEEILSGPASPRLIVALSFRVGCRHQIF